MTTPAQRAARERFADERRRLRAADRKLHTRPPRSVDVLIGLWSCAACKELRWGGEREVRATPSGVRFYDPLCAPAPVEAAV